MFRPIRFSAALPLFAALFLLSMASCRTAQKYVESGDYDGAIDFCVQKLQGKKKKKDEYVRGLEVAFEKAQARDLERIDHLVAADRPENWARVNELHRKIRVRQGKIQPLLPLRSSEGYAAHFDFVNIGKLENESREKAAEHLYSYAESQLRRAEAGDRLAARDAYQSLTELETRYFRSYRDKETLKASARRLGTSYVLFEMKNQSDRVLPRTFADRLLAMSKGDLDSDWKSFHFEAKPGETFDYKVVFKVRQVDVSPERVRERAYTDEKDIQDGWNYVLDARGNVKKDTNGNDIKTPRMVRIRADVLEALQTKAVRLSGTVEIFDAERGTLLDTHDLSTEVLFEHYASTFVGDSRALSDDSRCRIGSSPAPFPRDEDMLAQAADRLKPNLREELRRNRAIL